MKILINIFIFIIITKNVLTKNNDNLKNKNDSTGGVCKYINELLEELESYDCCKHDGITCENNHITKM